MRGALSKTGAPSTFLSLLCVPGPECSCFGWQLLLLYRDWESGTRKVNIIVQKMRNKAAGKIGSHELLYEVETGRYSSLDEDGF